MSACLAACLPELTNTSPAGSSDVRDAKSGALMLMLRRGKRRTLTVLFVEVYFNYKLISITSNLQLLYKHNSINSIQYFNYKHTVLQLQAYFNYKNT